MEAIQAPEPTTVVRGEKVPTNPDDDFRVDGTRYYHGLRHCMSRDKSTQTGKTPNGFEKKPVSITFLAGGCRLWTEISPQLAFRACRPEKCMSDPQPFNFDYNLTTLRATF